MGSLLSASDKITMFETNIQGIVLMNEDMDKGDLHIINVKWCDLSFSPLQAVQSACVRARSIEWDMGRAADSEGENIIIRAISGC